MQYRLIEAVARPDLTVSLTFEDGVSGTVDMRPNAELGGVCEPLRDPTFFVSAMHLADEGFVLAWSDEIEFSADSLRYKARPEDYRRDFPDLAAE
jgi:hypothetical protein